MAALVDESKKIFVLPRLGTKKPYFSQWNVLESFKQQHKDLNIFISASFNDQWPTCLLTYLIPLTDQRQKATCSGGPRPAAAVTVCPPPTQQGYRSQHDGIGFWKRTSSAVRVCPLLQQKCCTVSERWDHVTPRKVQNLSAHRARNNPHTGFPLAGMPGRRMIHFPYKEHQSTLWLWPHTLKICCSAVSMQTGYEVGSLMWLRASHFISLQPIIPAQVTVMVTGLFFFFLAKAPISNP